MENKSRPSPDFLIVLAILVVFGNSLFCRWALDDYRHLVDNQMIRSLPDAFNSFSSALFPGNLYRPLVILSYWLVYSFSKLHPFWHHLMNVVLHMGACLLVYRLSLRLVTQKTAFLLTLFFAINPMRVEAVTNVSGRAELLSAFFGLLSVLLFSGLTGATLEKNRSIRWQALLFVTFLFALLSKESAVTFLLLGPLYVYFAGKKCPPWSQLKTAAFPVMLAFFVYLGLRVAALGSLTGASGAIDFLDNPLVGVSVAERVMNALALLGRYVFLSLVPLQLSADYSFAAFKPLPLWLSLEALVWLYFLVLVVFLALRKPRSFDMVSFFALWFLLAFVVTSNVLFPIGTVFAERLSYVPGIGIAGMIAVALRAVSTLALRRILIAVALLFFGAKSILQNRFWLDNFTLHSYQLAVSGQSAKTVLNYGVLLRLSGKMRESSRQFEKALAIYPAFADASYNLALNELAMNHEADARIWLDKTLQLNSQHTPALSMVGRLTLKHGEIRAAEEFFRRALKGEPYDFTSQIGLLAVFMADGRLKDAEALLADLKRVSPNHPDIRKMDLLLHDSLVRLPSNS